MLKKPDISKVTDFNQFMLWCSLLIFIDCYLIILDNKSIFNISFTYIQKHVGHLLIMIVLYFFSMSVMSKALQLFVHFIDFAKESIYIKFNINSEPEKINYSNYLLEDDVLNLSIIHNSSSLYKQYEENKNINQEIYLQQKIASGLLFLCIINYFISSNDVISLMKSYEIFSESTSTWYMNLLIPIPMFIIMFIFYIAFKQHKLNNYIYIDDEIQEKLRNKDNED